MKQVIFNVGGALASYTEFDNKKLIVDLGKSQNFHPVTDFLLPLYQRRNDEKGWYSGKYQIDQLILSHPHSDHLSGIEEFDEYFHPDLLTCPNDNDGMPTREQINWNKFEDTKYIQKLKEMLVGRHPPLRTTSDDNEFIYYLAACDVEEDNALNDESYCNNISISVFLKVNEHNVFLPADMQKLGLSELLDKNDDLKNLLGEGVDVLITPHHGLKSSFSTDMFDQFKDGKTRCLNVVSEKVNTTDNREVDSRYSTLDYCSGENDIGGDESHYQVKTSRGHLLIDYSKKNRPSFEIIKDNEELLDKFIAL